MCGHLIAMTLRVDARECFPGHFGNSRATDWGPGGTQEAILHDLQRAFLEGREQSFREDHDEP